MSRKIYPIQNMVNLKTSRKQVKPTASLILHHKGKDQDLSVALTELSFVLLIPYLY